MKHMVIALEEPFPEGCPGIAGPLHPNTSSVPSMLYSNFLRDRGVEESNRWTDKGLEYTHHTFRGRSVCPGIKTFGFERWQFWRKRISELRAGLMNWILANADNTCILWVAICW